MLLDRNHITSLQNVIAHSDLFKLPHGSSGLARKIELAYDKKLNQTTNPSAMLKQ